MRSLTLAITFAVFSTLAAAQAASAPDFPPAADWVTALQSPNPAELGNLYSTSPPARSLDEQKQGHDISEELGFWDNLKKSGARDFQVTQRESGEQQGLRLVSVTVSFRSPSPSGLRTRYVFEDQAWQQQGPGWRIVLVKRSDVLKTPQPSKLNPNLYPPNVNARAEIKAALARASRDGKRVLLVFGANWCYDCHVLDYEFHQPAMAKLVDGGYVVVHVDVGEYTRNTDLAAQYKVALKRGVPALAVLDRAGKLLYSDQNGEFEKARSMDPETVIAFLNKWKP